MTDGLDKYPAGYQELSTQYVDQEGQKGTTDEECDSWYLQSTYLPLRRAIPHFQIQDSRKSALSKD